MFFTAPGPILGFPALSWLVTPSDPTEPSGTAVDAGTLGVDSGNCPGPGMPRKSPESAPSGTSAASEGCSERGSERGSEGGSGSAAVVSSTCVRSSPRLMVPPPML